MRRFLPLFLCLLLLPAAALAQGQAVTLGVCIYNGDDTFMASVLKVIQNEARGRATLSVCDGQNDQNLQNDQIEALLKSGVNALIINPVDRTAAIYQLQMAMQYDTPVVLINREPIREDLSIYDRAYYVGIDPKQQGLLAGRLAADYFLAHPEADSNGDGKMQLVLFRGEPGHQDAELRSFYAIRALQDAGVALDVLSEEVAMWERTQAQERMSVLLNAYPNRIECVIANNDDMALGAIDALKAAGYFSGGRYMPVLGNEATLPALEALLQGSLYATVSNNAEQQGSAALTLAMLLATGEAVTPENFPYQMEGKFVYINSSYYRTEQK